jgi:hypothetical protein
MKKFFAMGIVAAVAAAVAAAGCGGKEETTYLTSIESVREHLKGEWYYSDGTLAYTYLDSTYIHSSNIDYYSCLDTSATFLRTDTLNYTIRQDGGVFFVEKIILIPSYIRYSTSNCSTLHEFLFEKYRDRIISLTDKKYTYRFDPEGADEEVTFYRK